MLGPRAEGEGRRLIAAAQSGGSWPPTPLRDLGAAEFGQEPSSRGPRARVLAGEADLDPDATLCSLIAY